MILRLRKIPDVRDDGWDNWDDTEIALALSTARDFNWRTTATKSNPLYPDAQLFYMNADRKMVYIGTPAMVVAVMKRLGWMIVSVSNGKNNNVSVDVEAMRRTSDGGTSETHAAEFMSIVNLLHLEYDMEAVRAAEMYLALGSYEAVAQAQEHDVDYELVRSMHEGGTE
jgi:hypothetical protein